MKRTLAVFAIATVGFLGLAGCAATADSDTESDTTTSAETSTEDTTTEDTTTEDTTDGEDAGIDLSAAEQCAALNGPLQELSTAMATYPTDPAGSAAPLADAAAGLQDASADTDGDLRTAIDALVPSLETLAASAESGSLDTTALTDVSEKMLDLTAACGVSLG